MTTLARTVALSKTITLPQVSLNGTSKQELVEQQCEVMNAARALKQALSKAYPHPRDYQYDGNNHEFAMEEHRAMQKLVEKVFDRADAIAMALTYEV